MKKYIKPTAKIIELSVKESLSDMPNGFANPGVSRRKNAVRAYAVTAYTFNSANDNTPA